MPYRPPGRTPSAGPRKTRDLPSVRRRTRERRSPERRGPDQDCRRGRRKSRFSVIEAGGTKAAPRRRRRRCGRTRPPKPDRRRPWWSEVRPYDRRPAARRRRLSKGAYPSNQPRRMRAYVRVQDFVRNPPSSRRNPADLCVYKSSLCKRRGRVARRCLRSAETLKATPQRGRDGTASSHFKSRRIWRRRLRGRRADSGWVGNGWRAQAKAGWCTRPTD